MLQVLGSDETRILNKEQKFEWFDLTGKELKISESEKAGVVSITLDIKQEGRKTPISLFTIATVTIAPEIAERIAEDALLASTIAEFARNTFQPKLTMVSDSISNAIKSNHVVSLTGINPVNIVFLQRIERDEDDNVISTDVIAQVEGNSSVHVYSPAGVFDPA